MTSFCEHFEPGFNVDPPILACASCVEIGDTWVHLRQCLTCGRTGCCDLSRNKHATAHFRETGHPMIRSVEPGEDWLWCYPDDRLYQLDSATDEGPSGRVSDAIPARVSPTGSG